jgi:hypothetical protein
MKNQRLNNILKHTESQYPRIGIPLETSDSSFRGHVITSSNTGIYLEIPFDSESKALEYSANYVVNVRINGSIR